MQAMIDASDTPRDLVESTAPPRCANADSSPSRRGRRTDAGRPGRGRPPAQAQRETLLALIAGWGGADDPDVEGLVDDIARRLAAEDQPAELLASDH